MGEIKRLPEPESDECEGCGATLSGGGCTSNCPTRGVVGMTSLREEIKRTLAPLRCDSGFSISSAREYWYNVTPEPGDDWGFAYRFKQFGGPGKVLLSAATDQDIHSWIVTLRRMAAKSVPIHHVGERIYWTTDHWEWPIPFDRPATRITETAECTVVGVAFWWVRLRKDDGSEFVAHKKLCKSAGVA